MAVIAFLGMAVVCVFFLYVLVQFWLEEKHLRRRDEIPIGFPMVSSGQIVMPLETPREKQHKDSAVQNRQGDSKNRR